MDFLNKELEGLPSSVAATVLKQLERAIRAAAMSIHAEGPDTDANARRICARIAASIEFAQEFKKSLDTEDTL
jgi:tRNA U34 2-thiouridine synthase MnmA/TrmU